MREGYGWDGDWEIRMLFGGKTMGGFVAFGWMEIWNTGKGGYERKR